LRKGQCEGLGCSSEEEPKKQTFIFHPYGEKKSLSDLHKILHWGDIQDVITDTNFGFDRLRGFNMARDQILGFSIGFCHHPYRLMNAENIPSDKPGMNCNTGKRKTGK